MRIGNYKFDGALSPALSSAAMESKGLTTREVAERLGVPQGTVRVWLGEIPPRFPNARQEETRRGPVWVIPESDLEGFKVRPRGRPAKPEPAKKAGGAEEASQPVVEMGGLRLDDSLVPSGHKSIYDYQQQLKAKRKRK